MRTTVDLPDHLLVDAKKLAAERHVPLTTRRAAESSSGCVRTRGRWRWTTWSWRPWCGSGRTLGSSILAPGSKRTGASPGSQAYAGGTWSP